MVKYFLRSISNTPKYFNKKVFQKVLLEKHEFKILRQCLHRTYCTQQNITRRLRQAATTTAKLSSIKLYL